MTRGSLLVDTAPASCWQDAFPVGNGRHGALVHGRPWVESTIVTHHHLVWPDGPAAPGPPNLADRLPRVRDLLLAGESRRALELFTGDWPRYHTRVTATSGAGLTALAGGHAVRVTGCRQLTLLTRVAPFRDTAGIGAARAQALEAVAAVPVGRRPAGRRSAGEPRQAAGPDQPLPALLEKLFSSGRYLLLSASGLLPPRLTGLWQGDWNSAWSGAITTDANLGLQLAGAVTTEVPAAVDALANLIREQLPDWRVNARRLFGTRGIVAPAHTDGRSGLSTHFEPRWPLHMWTAGADSGGQVVFAPSYSPENEPAGWTPAAVNATMDIAAARHALLAAAATVLAVDTVLAGDIPTDRDAARRWRELAQRLPPYRLTSDGALAEWSWPPEGTGRPPLAGNDEHRHVSHLYPVWPLHEITVAGTPALAAAALRALRLRGAQDDSAHGYLHKALAAARLRDADLAGRLLAALTGQGFFFRSLMSSHYPKRAVYNADAACALPGVLAELLVDSVPAGDGGTCRIELLPAVPNFLPSGRLRGARTLAGVRVAELRWDNVAGRAEVVLLSASDREADVSCRRSAPVRRVMLPAGIPVRLTWEHGSD
jgi:alpha-L-fucosidase 2